VALSLRGCNSSHSLKLYDVSAAQSGAEPAIFPIAATENGTGLTKIIMEHAQVLL
jgi:hypothetical protein